MITDATLDSSYEHLEQFNKESVYSIDKDNTSTLMSNHYQVTVEPVIFCYAFGTYIASCAYHSTVYILPCWRIKRPGN